MNPEKRPVLCVQERPVRRGARGGPDVYRLTEEGGRGPDQQLDRPGRTQADDDQAVYRVHEGADDVRHPVLDGPIGSPISKIGVEITDSPYVVANMRIMTRTGTKVLQALGEDGSSSPACTRGRAAGRERGEGRPGPARPWRRSTSPTSPRRGRSGPTAPGTAGTRCWARNASPFASRPFRPATRAGWRSMPGYCASPTRRPAKYVGSGPSPAPRGDQPRDASIPTIPGWKVETIGDDIAWMKFGEDGRLYAINPEAGSSAWSARPQTPTRTPRTIYKTASLPTSR